MRIAVMVMSSRTSNRRLEQGRQRAGIPRREDLWLFFCEGKETEPKYIQALINAYPGKRKPTTCFETGRGTNMVLVNYAINKIAQTPGRTPAMIFIVFDNDEEGSEKLFCEAVEECDQQGYIPLWSNTCFELWLLLHFQDCQGAIAPADYCKKLSRHLRANGIVEKYDKTDPQIHAYVNHNHAAEAQAIRRSKKLLHSYDPEMNYDQRNPATTMHVLLEYLKEYSKRKC